MSYNKHNRRSSLLSMTSIIWLWEEEGPMSVHEQETIQFVQVHVGGTNSVPQQLSEKREIK